MSADAEYSALDPLAVRIATHRLYSEQPDDVDQAVINALGLDGTERLLDVGCGTGEFLARLLRNGHKGPLVGLDTSPAAICSTCAVPGITGLQASATEIPVEAEGFDLVTARHMLYHVPEPMRALEEFRRVVRSDGQVAAVVNHPETAPRIRGLVSEEASDRGVSVSTGMAAQVHSDNLPEMFDDVFHNVRTIRHDNWLVFEEAEPLIVFAIALFSFCGIAPDHPARDAIAGSVRKKIERWYGAGCGPWRDPKGYTVCIARR